MRRSLLVPLLVSVACAPSGEPVAAPPLAGARTTETLPAWTSVEVESGFDVALADHDGDGDLDLAIANDDPLGNQPNRIYRNDGGASFTPVATVGVHGQGVDWGDVDRDGDPDLVVCGATVQLYANTNGAFALRWTSPLAGDAWDCALGDADGDGDPDLAVGKDRVASEVYRNVNGTFQAWWSTPVVHSAWSVAWVDVDRDGDLDLSLGNRGIFGEANTIYANTGAAFSLAWTSPEVDETVGQAWGDLDGDGWPDLVVVNRNGNDRVYRNVNGTPRLASSPNNGGDSWDVALGDDDADGDLDVFLGRRNVPDRILLNDGAGALTLGWQSTLADDTTGVAVGDLDGDGDLDHATSTYGDGAKVWLGGADGPCDLRVAGTTGVIYPTGIAWGDADGDGDLDLAWADLLEDGVQENTGGQLSAGWTAPNAELSSAILWTDVDLDGDQDLVSVGDGDTYDLVPTRVYENAGNGTFTLRQSLQAEFSTAAAVADVDGDGDEDLFVANEHGCTLYQCTSGRDRLYRNDNGRFVSAWRTPGGERSNSAAFGDLDGDGDPDLAVGIDGNTQVYVNSGGAFALGWTAPVNEFAGGVAWGDADADGDLDLAVGSFDGPARVYENVGGALLPTWVDTAAPETTEVAWGDWDGDGDLELATGGTVFGDRIPIEVVALGPNNTWTELWSSPFPIDTARLAFADVDGDGRDDLTALDELESVVVINPADSDGDALPDACEPLHLEPPRAVVGQSADLVAIGAQLGSTVTFVGSARRGATAVPGCPGLDADLASPTILGSAAAGVDGVASTSAVVPAAAGGRTVWVQAVDAGRCVKGDLLQVDVP